MAPAIELVASVRDGLGESPLWDPAEGVLYRVDSLAPCIHALDPGSGAVRRWDMPSPVGSIGLAAPGCLLAALEDGFHEVDLATGAIRPLWRRDPLPGTRLNDGKMDRDGRYVCGTMQVRDDAPDGAVFRLGPGGVCEVLEDGMGVMNATCFSPDGAILYYTDSRVGTLWRRAYGDRPGPRQPFAAVREMTGSAADGATVDADGCIWTALVRTGQLARFTPDGALDRLIDLPVPHPTCPAFGGPGLDVVFVTSISRSGRLHSDHPEAGRMVAVTGLGVAGLPEARYRA